MRPSLNCSGNKTVGAFARFALTRTPVLGPRFPPDPTEIPEEIGLLEVNSHRTACENKADMMHLTLAFVPVSYTHLDVYKRQRRDSNGCRVDLVSTQWCFAFRRGTVSLDMIGPPMLCCDSTVLRVSGASCRSLANHVPNANPSARAALATTGNQIAQTCFSSLTRKSSICCALVVMLRKSESLALLTF